MVSSFGEFIIEQSEQFILSLRAKVSAAQTQVIEQMEDGSWKVAIAAVPEDGKANAAIIKFLRKEHGLNCEIKNGTTSRNKLLSCTK